MGRPPPPYLAMRIAGYLEALVGLTVLPRHTLKHVAGLYYHTKALEGMCAQWRVHVHISGSSSRMTNRWMPLFETCFDDHSDEAKGLGAVYGRVHAQQTMMLAETFLANAPNPRYADAGPPHRGQTQAARPDGGRVGQVAGRRAVRHGRDMQGVGEAADDDLPYGGAVPTTGGVPARQAARPAHHTDGAPARQGDDPAVAARTRRVLPGDHPVAPPREQRVSQDRRPADGSRGMRQFGGRDNGPPAPTGGEPWRKDGRSAAPTSREPPVSIGAPVRAERGEGAVRLSAAPSSAQRTAAPPALCFAPLDRIGPIRDAHTTALMLAVQREAAVAKSRVAKRARTHHCNARDERRFRASLVRRPLPAFMERGSIPRAAGAASSAGAPVPRSNSVLPASAQDLEGMQDLLDAVRGD